MSRKRLLCLLIAIVTTNSSLQHYKSVPPVSSLAEKRYIIAQVVNFCFDPLTVEDFLDYIGPNIYFP